MRSRDVARRARGVCQAARRGGFVTQAAEACGWWRWWRWKSGGSTVMGLRKVMWQTSNGGPESAMGDTRSVVGSLGKPWV